MALATGRVEYSIGKIVVDGVDPGDLPDLIKLSGYIQFIPDQPDRTDPDTGMQVLLDTFKAGIDSDGVMRDSQSNPYITLPTGSWQAHIKLMDSPIEVGPYLVIVEEDQTTNLADAAPATSTGRVVVLTGPPGPPGPAGPQGPTGTGGVSSVNGHTGAVSLTPADVGAQPAGSYPTTSGVQTQIDTALDGLAAVAHSGNFSDLAGVSAQGIMDMIDALLLERIGGVLVFHGSDANYTRPTLPNGVRAFWYGTVAPNNAIPIDVHTNVTAV